jgi:hypothetical protein
MSAAKLWRVVFQTSLKCGAKFQNFRKKLCFLKPGNLSEKSKIQATNLFSQTNGPPELKFIAQVCIWALKIFRHGLFACVFYSGSFKLGRNDQFKTWSVFEIGTLYRFFCTRPICTVQTAGEKPFLLRKIRIYLLFR